MKVFLDTDIILDIAIKREPFYDDSAKVFSLIESGKIEGVTSPVVLVNLFYIARKLLGIEGAKNYLKQLLTVIDVASVTKSEVQSAIDSDFSDFEDAVQNFSAISNSVDAIITRNINDYKTSALKIFTPQDFLNSNKD